MLVLTRRVGESIQIGDNIVVHVTRVKAGRVTIAFEAPNDVRILRSELSPRSLKMNNHSSIAKSSGAGDAAVGVPC